MLFKKLRKRRRATRIPSDRLNENGTLVPEEKSVFTLARPRGRIANRRKFRVEVSGNRKWIMIGVAVVAVCATIVYLSVTYGGGLVGLLL